MRMMQKPFAYLLGSFANGGLDDAGDADALFTGVDCISYNFAAGISALRSMPMMLKPCACQCDNLCGNHLDYAADAWVACVEYGFNLKRVNHAATDGEAIRLSLIALPTSLGGPAKHADDAETTCPSMSRLGQKAPR